MGDMAPNVEYRFIQTTYNTDTTYNIDYILVTAVRRLIRSSRKVPN